LARKVKCSQHILFTAAEDRWQIAYPSERVVAEYDIRYRFLAVMVTDDFLALIVANRLRVSCQLFLDFAVGRATRGELTMTESEAIVQAVSPHYPSGFVPHSLAMLRKLS
jgi:hypothetical protein